MLKPTMIITTMEENNDLIVYSVENALLPLFEMLLKHYDPERRADWLALAQHMKSAILQDPHMMLEMEKLPYPEKLTAIVDKLFNDFTSKQLLQ